MPTVEQKPTKLIHKRSSLSLTVEKTTKKTSKKKKKTVKKSAKSESRLVADEVLEVEGLNNFEKGDESDSSNNKTPIFPKLSTSDVTVNINSSRAVSTDSVSTKSSSTKQLDTASSLPQTKSQLSSVDTLSAKLSNVSLKNKASKSKTRSSSSKKDNTKISNKKSTEVKTSKSSIMPNIIEAPRPTPVFNESVRWENELDSADLERERIHVYKINRRKRYLAAAHSKGLGWVKQYGANGFPLSEECSTLDNRRDISYINDYSSVIRNSQSHAILNEGDAIA